MKTSRSDHHGENYISESWAARYLAFNTKYFAESRHTIITSVILDFLRHEKCKRFSNNRYTNSTSLVSDKISYDAFIEPFFISQLLQSH